MIRGYRDYLNDRCKILGQVVNHIRTTERAQRCLTPLRPLIFTDYLADYLADMITLTIALTSVVSMLPSLFKSAPFL